MWTVPTSRFMLSEFLRGENLNTKDFLGSSQHVWGLKNLGLFWICMCPSHVAEEMCQLLMGRGGQLLTQPLFMGIRGCHFNLELNLVLKKGKETCMGQKTCPVETAMLFIHLFITRSSKVLRWLVWKQVSVSSTEKIKHPLLVRSHRNVTQCVTFLSRGAEVTC